MERDFELRAEWLVHNLYDVIVIRRRNLFHVILFLTCHSRILLTNLCENDKRPEVIPREMSRILGV